MENNWVEKMRIKGVEEVTEEPQKAQEVKMYTSNECSKLNRLEKLIRTVRTPVRI